MIQVHHIVEESKGGSNEFDNLIAACITCHSDVHTHRPFTRRFSAEELKRRRDEVIRLVAEGKLVPPDDTTIDLASLAEVVESKRAVSFSRLAVEILIGASQDIHGHVMCARHRGGAHFSAGPLSKSLSHGRELAQYESAIEELEDIRLIKPLGFDTGLWELTHQGFLAADEAAALGVDISPE